tara:strand:+ start:1228 stop:1599 length:372 start_codon:yes stop_codon:yes gene_type:complete
MAIYTESPVYAYSVDLTSVSPAAAALHEFTLYDNCHTLCILFAWHLNATIFLRNTQVMVKQVVENHTAGTTFGQRRIAPLQSVQWNVLPASRRPGSKKFLIEKDLDAAATWTINIVQWCGVET